jgi:2-polyprenyl-3-methyl-5-hydroxy-6-metoxy-1,4-benzoquinol methylase
MNSQVNPEMNPAVPLAHDDWDRHWQDYAEAAAANPAQRYRRRIVCEVLKRHGCSNAARILDVGSGQGDLALDLRRAFPKAELAGIELSATGVEVSAAKVPDARFFQRDLLASGENSGELRSWAQYAICAEVLEHLDEPSLLLKNASEYLAPGCRLVVTVPGGPQSEFDRHIGHRRHFTPLALKELLEASGFTVELSTTAGFPFFNFYRMVVILRGRRLIADVQSGSHGPSGSKTLARAAMGLFDVLFGMNMMGSGLGWQTVAVARYRFTAP